MTGARSYTTKIWRQPSSIGFSSADALSTSMDPPGEPVISTWKRPCQKIQNGSEFPELVAQNFRNPHMSHICFLSGCKLKCLRKRLRNLRKRICPRFDFCGLVPPYKFCCANISYSARKIPYPVQ